MLFFTRGRHQNVDVYYISQSWSELLKNTIRNNWSRIMLFPQTLKDITMIYNDISGLHMNFSEWRDFCRDAWKKRYNFIQIDKDEDLDDMYSNKNIKFKDYSYSRDRCFLKYNISSENDTIKVILSSRMNFEFIMTKKV